MGTMLEMQFRLAETISVAFQPTFHFDIDADLNNVLDLSIFTKETLDYIEFCLNFIKLMWFVAFYFLIKFIFKGI